MLTLRLATPDDIPAYLDHTLRHFRESGQGTDFHFHPVTDFEDWKREEQTAKLLEEWALPVGKVGWQRVWIAETAGKIVADCHLRSGFMPATSHRCQFAIGVEREARGEGCGRSLSAIALSWARQETSLDWVDLWVFAHNSPAIALYESLGFERIHAVKDQFRIGGQSIDDIHMALRLRP